MGDYCSAVLKLVATIVEHEVGDATEMHKWYCEHRDVRDTLQIIEEVIAFLAQFGARSVVMPETIVGCPHEEDIDYHGSVCPECPFWANRDRWSDELFH